jgi:hypothetical protein
VNFQGEAVSVSFTAFDIGCQPSPSVPEETLLQNGCLTFLLFWATSCKADESTGRLKDLGVAVLECVDCQMSKFGYPNDEGFAEHPLYSAGLHKVSAPVVEVHDSPWVQDVVRQILASRTRIWSNERQAQHPDPPNLRHFLIPLKEMTFECVAETVKVDRYFATFDEARDYCWNRLRLK